MKYIVCTKCSIKQPVNNFGPNKTRPQGIQSYCRSCMRKATLKSYEKHKGRYFIRAKERDAAMDALILTYKSKPCRDCGKTYPPYVMDFDHVDPKNKEYGVCHMRRKRMAFSKIVEEIEKCELVCANCHRERTEKRSPYPSRYKKARLG